MKKDITVYTKWSCVHCLRMKDWLKEHHIDYKETDVTEISDPNLLETIKGVPHTIIKNEDGTEHVVTGFNVKTLSGMIL